MEPKTKHMFGAAPCGWFTFYNNLREQYVLIFPEIIFLRNISV
jgi:hypothetical protein